VEPWVWWQIEQGVELAMAVVEPASLLFFAFQL